tara:strand:+ start:225 stop:506 length:282 start_codon:yes stop_codon:yes gene_type:complete
MNFEIWVTGAEFLSLHFSQLNQFGFVFIMAIIILAGFALAMQGITLSSNSYNTKMTQFAGDIMSLAGVGILGLATVLTISIDYAIHKGLINFI